jgi:ATP-dependent RNA helicase DHX8/PRP22
MELAPKFYRVHDPTKLSKAKQKQRIEPLFDKYNEPDSWRLSKRKKAK